jgi:hypothetical protein
MTPTKQTTIEVITWCLNRIRAEREDYELAADDVANKLAFLADWLRAESNGLPNNDQA